MYMSVNTFPLGYIRKPQLPLTQSSILFDSNLREKSAVKKEKKFMQMCQYFLCRYLKSYRFEDRQDRPFLERSLMTYVLTIVIRESVSGAGRMRDAFAVDKQSRNAVVRMTVAAKAVTTMTTIAVPPSVAVTVSAPGTGGDHSNKSAGDLKANIILKLVQHFNLDKGRQ
jgi:hypothetical protein